MNRPRPRILSERGFNRRLAAMVLLAALLHLLAIAAATLFGGFRLRPDTPGETYTVEVVDSGDLGGHLPAGLPVLDVGPPGRARKGDTAAAGASARASLPAPPAPPAPP